MEHSIGFPKLPEIAKEMRAKGETTRRVEKSFGFYSQGVDYWSLGSISLRLEGDLELNPKDPSGKWTFRGTIEMKEPENELYDMNMDASSVENRDPLANSIIFIFKQLQELGCCKDFNMYINGKKEIILTQDDYPEEGGISSTQKKFKKKEQPRIARHEDDLLDGHPIDKRFKKSRNDGPYPGKAELNQNNTKNSTNKAVIANQRNGRRRVS
jgi:hypothetical protein